MDNKFIRKEIKSKNIITQELIEVQVRCLSWLFLLLYRINIRISH